MPSTRERRHSAFGRLFDVLVSGSTQRLGTGIDLSPMEADLLVAYQLSLDDPHVLGAQAFHVAKVAQSKDMSIRIHNALLKAHILVAREQAEHGLTVDTSLITRHLVNQLSFCTAHMMRRTISLLFAFEEQLVRWLALDDEASELHRLLSHPPEGMRPELELRLEAVEWKRRLLPSQQQQGEEVGNDQDLPVYSEA